MLHTVVYLINTRTGVVLHKHDLILKHFASSHAQSMPENLVINKFKDSKWPGSGQTVHECVRCAAGAESIRQRGGENTGSHCGRHVCSIVAEISVMRRGGLEQGLSLCGDTLTKTLMKFILSFQNFGKKIACAVRHNRIARRVLNNIGWGYLVLAPI